MFYIAKLWLTYSLHSNLDKNIDFKVSRKTSLHYIIMLDITISHVLSQQKHKKIQIMCCNMRSGLQLLAVAIVVMIYFMNVNNKHRGVYDILHM